MANTYICNTVHFIFGTKGRHPLIRKPLQEDLWRYMAGVAKRHGAHPLAVGGIEDHAHALLQLPGSIDLSTTMRYVKGASSKWFRETHVREFAWQDGFAAFSVSPSLIPKTVLYIERQAIHRKKMDFQAEYLLLLQKHGIAYDEIQFIREGRGIWKVDGKTFEGGAGDIFVIKAGEVHEFKAIGDEALVQVDVHLSPRFIQENL